MGTPYEGRRDLLDIKGFASPPGRPLPNDDLDLQLVWLKALSEIGPNSLDAKALGEYWLAYIGPPWNEYGIGKANLRMGLVPPMSGELNNANWKHSNGAWIRTEIWACTHPALPERAIRFAFEDACVDHGFGEGSFAAIFIAAIQSSAFVIKDIDTLLQIGLSKIPEDCRVARSVSLVLDCHQQGMDWKACRNAVVADSADLGWFQAPANLAFVVLGLKYGGGDFKKSLILAINCGDDTDCTGATLGATLGIIHGMEAIPPDWQAYIGDEIVTLSVIKGSSYFPGTCSELTDLVMDLLPVTTYRGYLPRPGQNPGSPQNSADEVALCDEPQDDSQAVDPAQFLGRGFVKRLAQRARYSYTYSNEILKALVEFEQEPIIAPGASVKVRISVTLTNCRTFRHATLCWHTPEGFSVSGRNSVFCKWITNETWNGVDELPHYQVDSANHADLLVTAGDRVQAVNRLIVEISTPGQCQPLLVPVTLLS